MNKLDRIRKLHKEYDNSPVIFPLFEELLNILEYEYTEESPIGPDVIPCCGKFETCTYSCACRADYWRDNARCELNKLALSILKESLKDEGYRQTWVANLEMALYDTVRHLRRSHEESVNIKESYGNGMANLFLERLFGGIK